MNYLEDLPDGLWSVTAASPDRTSAAQLTFGLSGIGDLPRSLVMHIERPRLQALTATPGHNGQTCLRAADPALGGRPSFASEADNEQLDRAVTVLVSDGIEACQDYLRAIACAGALSPT